MQTGEIIVHGMRIEHEWVPVREVRQRVVVDAEIGDHRAEPAQQHGRRGDDQHRAALAQLFHDLHDGTDQPPRHAGYAFEAIHARAEPVQHERHREHGDDQIGDHGEGASDRELEDQWDLRDDVGGESDSGGERGDQNRQTDVSRHVLDGALAQRLGARLNTLEIRRHQVGVLDRADDDDQRRDHCPQQRQRDPGRGHEPERP